MAAKVEEGDRTKSCRQVIGMSKSVDIFHIFMNCFRLNGCVISMKHCFCA